MNHSYHNNDWYEELCALAAIGELSAAEFTELQQHVSECGNCRELYADFCRISSDDLGLVAIHNRTEAITEGCGPLDGQLLLARFLERAEHERVIVHTPVIRRLEEPAHSFKLYKVKMLNMLRSPVLRYCSVALLFCAVVGVGSYQLRSTQLSRKLSQLNSQLNIWKDQAQVSTEGQKSASDLLKQSQAERDALQKSTLHLQTEYHALRAQKEILERNLASANSQLNDAKEVLQATQSSAEQKEKLLQNLQAELQNANQRAAEREAFVASLERKMRQGEQESSANLAIDDAEAKELFGARDLHIVDVYDVDGRGKTRRTYGRVYYVQKKFLVFYAFDLQDKKRNRTTAGFQAWGYRQASAGKAEDLGLFYVDDASVNRWILKVNNPRVLERIDAVFVTLEPPEGSPSPRGRKLLYANLGGPPNHP